MPEGLRVRGPRIFVVRHPRPDGRSVISRFYFRRSSAIALARRRRDAGLPVRVFTTKVQWTEVEF